MYVRACMRACWHDLAWLWRKCKQCIVEAAIAEVVTNRNSCLGNTVPMEASHSKIRIKQLQRILLYDDTALLYQGGPYDAVLSIITRWHFVELIPTLITRWHHWVDHTFSSNTAEVAVQHFCHLVVYQLTSWWRVATWSADRNNLPFSRRWRQNQLLSWMFT